MITTTPRPTRLVRDLIADASTVVTRARTIDNRNHLAPSFLADVLARYGGTRLDRQELDGEIMLDDPDALFSRELIERYRLRNAPELKRIVVAVDPPASEGERANACGIIVAGLGVDGRGYVLADRSVRRLSPLKWAERVVKLANLFHADRVVAEANQGGSMVKAVLQQVDATLSLRMVHASTGKQARAEPVAALGGLPELEDEMSTSRAASRTSADCPNSKMKCAPPSPTPKAPTASTPSSGPSPNSC